MPRDTPQPSARDAEWALMLAWVAGDEPAPEADDDTPPLMDWVTP